MPALEPRVCVVCSADYKPNTAMQLCCGDSCRAERGKILWREKQTVRHQRNCQRCGTLMPPRTRKDGNKLYCGPVCKAVPLPAQNVEGGEPCAHCSRLFVKTKPRQKFCGVSCRVGAFKAKHAPADGDNSEIEIRDLDDAPRRLRVARLFALYDGCADEYLAPAFTPTRFANPNDKRASR